MKSHTSAWVRVCNAAAFISPWSTWQLLRFCHSAERQVLTHSSWVLNHAKEETSPLSWQSAGPWKGRGFPGTGGVWWLWAGQEGAIVPFFDGCSEQRPHFQSIKRQGTMILTRNGNFDVRFLLIHFLFFHFLATASGLFLTLYCIWQDQALNYKLSPNAGFPLTPNPVHPPADVDFCPCSGWETAELFLVLGFRKARGPSGSSVILHTSIFKLFLSFWAVFSKDGFSIQIQLKESTVTVRLTVPINLTQGIPSLTVLALFYLWPSFLWVMGKNECTNGARTEQPFCISHISHSFIFLSLFSCYHSIYGGKKMCGWFVEEQNVPWIDMKVSNDLGAVNAAREVTQGSQV